MKAMASAIRKLLKERRAILLAHNYQIPEVQDVADLCGDSLELSMEASKTDAEVIVFCGVHFMAETASILSPEKTVLLPVASAGCPMAEMITAADVRRLRREMGDVAVVSYVNTTASVKAESDICCTSANAVRVVRSIERGRKILMTPDRNLARYTGKETGREIASWDGYCPIHDSLSPEQVKKVKQAHPEALFLAHPECRPEVLDLADEILSTSGMIAFPVTSPGNAFILGTEVGILYPISKKNPGKTFIPADPGMSCPDMKKTGLKEILRALERMESVVKVPEDVALRARQAVERMLSVPRD